MSLTPSSAQDALGRPRLLARVCLAYLTVQAALIGLWATFAPRSWFRSFPGLGLHWVGIDGPYNHHLVVDVGALFLALLVVSVAALADGGQALVRTAGLAWAVSAFPHFVYHATHRAGLSASDWAMSLSGLAVQVVLGLVCLAASPTVHPALDSEPTPPSAPVAPGRRV